VFGQAWRQKEIIVVDDGSTDGTLAGARQFESNEVRVVTQPNQGAAVARVPSAGEAKAADLTRTIRAYFARDLYRNLEGRHSQIREFANARGTPDKIGRILDGAYRRGACENKWPQQKNLLAMTIDSDRKEHGASRGTISRSCENACCHSVYSALERLFRSAVRGHGLPFQRLGGECTGFAERRVGRGYDHAPCRNI